MAQESTIGDDGHVSSSEYSETDSHVSIATHDLQDHLEKDAKFHDAQYDRVAEVFSGRWSTEDAAALKKMGWTDRRDEDVDKWEFYVPYWTNPNWDPSLEVKFDGTMERAARGDTQALMRPAIQTGDRENRTSYTL